MRWTVHGKRLVYSSQWMELFLSDIEIPNGVRYEHHLIRLAPSVAVAVLGNSNQVLMLWRHRFTTDTWNWEIPGGSVEADEQPAQAAAREVEEETGWRPHVLSELAYIQSMAGIAEAEQHIFLAEGARYIGPSVDSHESDRIAWIPLADVPELIARRQIVGGATVVALLQLRLSRDRTLEATARSGCR
ncbi:NUDIX hydrolase [Actinobacteria bacterium YIM 96077]|uniref:NUDIX hydrolase n=1 Tax=Phytoactinopolyspora halophila TaxID=1981511 RepID=A0A329QC22_9ACTN|nr:NUDIX hydrolase [Phytoactinopolyspora halophila]AYY12657.1 NUDIX hydrolase [Actinobacteria bacterium YIM 96077]RAW09551.1 NUDIX hydrolase [Phytoactinopolyspora halophila]